MNFFLTGEEIDNSRFLRDIPQGLERYLLAHSRRYYMEGTFGTMLLQEMIGIGYYLRYDLVFANRPFELSFHIPSTGLTLLYMLKGELGFNSSPGLQEGKYYLCYLPATYTHKVHYTTGDLVLLQVDVADAMAGHSADYAVLDDIMSKADNGTSADIVCYLQGDIDYRVLSCIEALLNNKGKKWDTELMVQSTVSLLIKLFVEHLENDDEVMQSLYYVKRLEQVKSYIRDNLAGDLRIAKLSQIFQGASAALNKQFRKQYRSSLRTYIHEQKMAHALFLLQDKNITINEVADLTGYNNANNFTRAFTLYFNRSPSKARKDSGSNSSR